MAAEIAPTTLIVKITNGKEIRRFTADKQYLTWKYLSKSASKLFDSPSSKFSYVDDEGDTITFSSDDELAEAVCLAFKSSPAVLRLTLVPPTTKNAEPLADVPMTDATTGAEATPTAEAGAQAKPTTADASAAAFGVRKPDEMAAFFNTLAAQLPALVEQLPPGVRNLIPHAELDVAATLAANAAANASCAAAAAAADAVHAAAAAAADARPKTDTDDKTPEGVHLGVTCDRSGQCPIVGARYHLVGHNYDLCQAEFDKLGDKEKALYQKIPAPAARASEATDAANGVHPGVECDRSGMCPIVGMRYHLRGHNYDLCQAEYDKLSQQEKLLYTAVPPPCPGGGGGPWRRNGGGGGGGGWGRGWGHGGGGGGGWGHGGGWAAANNNAAGPPNNMNAAAGKLAARFVRDVTIFDGTQMAPNTPFTKIWRLKNTGELPWPAGTKMLYVGGDQMTSEMTVPLSRASPVLPGEEVDVAVEMMAPAELGRYLGYWRLVGPMGRRKFGQRVWCHVQVVDPADAAGQTAAFDEDEMKRTMAEIERKKSDLGGDGDDHDDDAAEEANGAMTTADEAAAAAAPTPDATAKPVPMAAEPTTPDLTDPTAAAPLVPALPVSEDAAERASDDGVLVTEGMLSDEPREKKEAPAPAASEGAPSGQTAIDKVTEALAAMGFTDAALVEVVVGKHGADLEACARDLAAATEWDTLLDDLEEMGFSNRDLNKSLMLKHSGNVKRTVRELVEDA